MTIKLEVGKAYRNRIGDIVVIVAEIADKTTQCLDNSDILQFIDSTGKSYTHCGIYNPTMLQTTSDLVEEFTDFRTQQEIYKHLANGGYVSNLEGERFLVGFNTEGILRRYDLYGVNLGEDNWYFSKPSDWTIAVPKVPNWYDNIPEQGVLCWCKGDGMEPVPRIIVKYFAGTAYPFRTKGGSSHAYAIPATLEELAKYIFGEQI